MWGRHYCLDYDVGVHIRDNVTIWWGQTYGEGTIIGINTSREVGCPSPVCQVSNTYL